MSSRPGLGGMQDDRLRPPAQIGCLIEPIAGAAQAHRWALRRELMLLQRRLATLFIVLALAGCAQGTTGQAGAPNTPHAPEKTESTPEHGGGDGGGGGGSM
jgi:hypothetical protein